MGGDDPYGQAVQAWSLGGEGATVHGDAVLPAERFHFNQGGRGQLTVGSHGAMSELDA